MADDAATIHRAKHAKVPLEELERERLALKVQHHAVRWKHRKSGAEYILQDIVRFAQGPVWCVVYVPAGEVYPVPFAADLQDFLRAFIPTPGQS